MAFSSPSAIWLRRDLGGVHVRGNSSVLGSYIQCRKVGRHAGWTPVQTLTSIPSLFGRLSDGYSAGIIRRWNMFIIACALSGIAEFAVRIPAKQSSIAI